MDGIRTVSADLVLIDLAPELSEGELEVVLVAAESKGLLKRGRLEELIAERAGKRLRGLRRRDGRRWKAATCSGSARGGR